MKAARETDETRAPSHRRRALLVSMLVFAAALGVGRLTNVWSAVGVGSLAVLWVVHRWARPVGSGSSGPNVRDAAVGLVSGVVMLAATHVAYTLAVDVVPALAAEADRLYAWLGDWPGPVWGAPILATAVLAEELVFRGVLVDQTGERWSRATLLVGGSALYALPQVLTGTWLLPLVAFGCGLIWMAQRLVSNGLTMPLLTHLVWSLGVFALFPLTG